MADALGMTEKAVLDGVLHSTFLTFVPYNSSLVIEEPAELPRFRGSAIPHCPIHVALDYTRTEPRMEQRGFMLDYMAEHGKLVHTLMQKWLGIAGVMYGRWRCAKCGEEFPKAGTRPVGLKGPVTHCGSPCEYIEYDIDAPAIGYTGHCDGLLVLRGKLLPIEMKVRKTDVVSKVQRTGPYSADNILQATSYRRCLPSQLGIPEEKFHDYIGLLYFDRFDIKNQGLATHVYMPSLFDDEVKARQRTNRIIELRKFNYLRGYCKTSQDRPYCPYHNICFSGSAARQLEQLLPGINTPIER